VDIGFEIKAQVENDWIPTLYYEKVRSGRTRSYLLEIPERENSAEILYTLLGIELKIGNKRFSCPDLATARYLSIFARLGCRKFAVPYDITQISVIADEMETAWHRTLLALDLTAKNASAQARGRARAALLRRIRNELADIGPGEQMPLFKQSTKQRR